MGLQLHCWLDHAAYDQEYWLRMYTILTGDLRLIPSRVGNIHLLWCSHAPRPVLDDLPCARDSRRL